MKIKKFTYNNRETTGIFLDIQNNRTLFCVFTAELKQDLSLITEEVQKDLAMIYEIYTKEPLSFIPDEVSEILFKYTGECLDPKMIGYFDTKVWEDSRNSIWIEESPYLYEQMQNTKLYLSVYEYISQEYNMNFLPTSTNVNSSKHKL